MSESELNYGELMAALEARGWVWVDLVDWLKQMDHEVNPQTVQAWTSAKAVAAGGGCPRWPLLLMNGVLGGMTFPKLVYFEREEFGAWAPWMHPGLLRALDYVRFVLDAPLKVSTAGGALGRHLENGTSMHNVDRVGYVMAADVILPVGFQLGHAFDLVRGAGVVSGLGLYPDWNQGPGLHLDVRHLSPHNMTRAATPREPATWSGVKGSGGVQVYRSASYVLTGQ